MYINVRNPRKGKYRHDRTRKKCQFRVQPKTTYRRGCHSVRDSAKIPWWTHYREALVLKYTDGMWYLQFRRGGAAKFAIRRRASRDDRERSRRARELHKHARTKRGTNESAAAAPVVDGRWYVTPYPAIVKLGPKSVVTSDRARRQIIIGDANAASGS